MDTNEMVMRIAVAVLYAIDIAGPSGAPGGVLREQFESSIDVLLRMKLVTVSNHCYSLTEAGRRVVAPMVHA